MKKKQKKKIALSMLSAYGLGFIHDLETADCKADDATFIKNNICKTCPCKFCSYYTNNYGDLPFDYIYEEYGRPLVKDYVDLTQKQVLKIMGETHPEYLL